MISILYMEAAAMRHKQKLYMRVTIQTANNLEKLKSVCGYDSIGHVVDKLVREKMIQLSYKKRGYDDDN